VVADAVRIEEYFGVEYGGWTREEGLIWGLVPYNESSMVATIVPWGSEEQFLFGQYFDPGEYRLYITLSDQLNILPVPELAFETSP